MVRDDAQLTFKKWTVIFVGLILPLCAQADYQITGQINLTSEWSPQIYLSAINDFDDQNVASEDFVINVGEIAADGFFTLEGNNLPSEDRLYRLHVCKKGDPISTIIIGGKEENHVHLSCQLSAPDAASEKERWKPCLSGISSAVSH
ncbi:MAG: hypothetical protein AAGJ18_15080 [Bacteroidota bacterium]